MTHIFYRIVVVNIAISGKTRTASMATARYFATQELVHLAISMCRCHATAAKSPSAHPATLASAPNILVNSFARRRSTVGSISANEFAMKESATLVPSRRPSSVSVAIRTKRFCAAPKLNHVSDLAQSNWTVVCIGARRFATRVSANPARKIRSVFASALPVTTALKSCSADNESHAPTPSPLARPSVKGSCLVANTSAPNNVTTTSVCVVMCQLSGNVLVVSLPRSCHVTKQIIRLQNESYS